MSLVPELLGGIWCDWIAFRRRRPSLAAEERQWRRLARRLARYGLARRPWEGPLDYARRVGAARPDCAAEVQAIASLYAGLRYGAAPAADFAELRRRVAAFRP